MKIKGSGQIIGLLFMILVLAFGIIISIYYISISADLEKDEYISGEAAASFAAVVIDSDRAKYYMQLRKTDNEYQEVARDLLEYTRTSRINRISVIGYGNTVGYYIYDTDGKQIGTKVSYDDYTSKIKAQLVECRDSWSKTRGNIKYTYRPLRTIDDLSVGYIVIESSVENSSLPLVIMFASLAAIVILIVLSCILVVILRNHYLNKIEEFAKAASSFTGSDAEGDQAEELKKKFETGRNDEIGRLGRALIAMINVISNSRESFSNAVFDATHDGMTKVYNKKHYEDKIDTFRGCSSICVIYFDVNNLKLINDTLGHERGDYVIKKAAEYIKEVTFSDSMCFRMGGDEFLLVITNHSYRDFYSIINKLDSECPVILSAETDSIKCSLAYGYAYDKVNYSYEKLLSEAEENMYRKKYEIKQQLNMPER